MSHARAELDVLAADGLVTVQDPGRPGWAHLGVPRAGWLDPAAARLAHRLVGNDEADALLEVTLAGIDVRLSASRWVAVTGAGCEVTIDGAARGHDRAEWLPAGSVLRLGPATTGVRTYLAVAGGLDVDPVLGSRATDTLAWVGPPRVEVGAVLPLGPVTGGPGAADVVTPSVTGPLRLHPGPRADRVEGGWEAVLAHLTTTAYVVGAASDRIGLRLDGTPVPGRRGELASEGVVLGAVQLPPSGQPVVFLADHPTTGGYPVVAVVEEADLGRCAQLRPGEPVRFAAART